LPDAPPLTTKVPAIAKTIQRHLTGVIFSLSKKAAKIATVTGVKEFIKAATEAPVQINT